MKTQIEDGEGEERIMRQKFFYTKMLQLLLKIKVLRDT